MVIILIIMSVYGSASITIVNNGASHCLIQHSRNSRVWISSEFLSPTSDIFVLKPTDRCSAHPSVADSSRWLLITDNYWWLYYWSIYRSLIDASCRPSEVAFDRCQFTTRSPSCYRSLSSMWNWDSFRRLSLQLRTARASNSASCSVSAETIST